MPKVCYKIKNSATETTLKKLGFKKIEGGYARTIKCYDWECIEKEEIAIHGKDKIIRYGRRKEWHTKNVYDWKTYADIELVRMHISDLIQLGLVEETAL